MGETALVCVLVPVWLLTLLYGGAGLGFKGSAAPSIGPGLGAAIAILIALVGAAVSVILVVVLATRYDTWWPMLGCACTLPVAVILVWVRSWARRRHRHRR